MWLGSACGNPEHAERFERVLTDWAAIKARMCECRDQSCAEAAWAEWTAYRRSINDKLDGAKPGADHERRGREIEQAIRDCRRKYVPEAGSGSGGS